MSQINRIGYVDEETGEPISQPLRTLDDVNQWHPYTDHTGVASVPLRKLVVTSGDRPRTLVCHDMAGGYLDDRFVQGVKHAEAYRFYHWANIDTFIYFSHYLVTIPPPCWTNAAHKHGVPVLGTFITEWDDGKSNCEQFLSSVAAYTSLAKKLVAIASYYKFDGWLINIENVIQADLVANLVGFVEFLTQEMHRSITNSTVLWYDSVIDSGKLEWQNEVNKLNRSFFDACDGIFLNYTWNDDNLQTSRELALQSGRPYDVYVGVDVYGRGCRGGGGFNTKEAVRAARVHYLSVAIFGQGWTHERQDKAKFLENENRFWLYLSPYCPSQGFFSPSLWWHVCQGFGQKMYIHGKVVQDSPWSNLSLQSVQSAVSLGLTGTDGPVTDQWSASLCTDYAFHGGSCVRLSSKMSRSDEPITYSVLELNIPQSSNDLLVSYTYKLLTPPDHCTVYLTLVSSHLDTNHPAVHRHLLPSNVGNERGWGRGSDGDVREERTTALGEDEVTGFLGRYSPEESSEDWVTRFYRVRVDEGDTLQARLCVLQTHREDGIKDEGVGEDVTLLLGQIQILQLTSSLRDVVLVTDLHCSDADHFRTDTGHTVTLVLHWAFPENCAVYYLVYYRTLCNELDKAVPASGCDDSIRRAELMCLGATHTNLYQLCGFNVPLSTQRVEFKVQPVHPTGLMLPFAYLPSVVFSLMD